MLQLNQPVVSVCHLFIHGHSLSNFCPAGFRLVSNEAINPGMTALTISALNNALSVSPRNPSGQVSLKARGNFVVLLNDL